ncbi:4-(cytidine 5'-diphospho)-2-C-methyl-D-erythritol kinase [Silvimonas amylolytica]|uniref:4-diphosphocytidyl-2-C-methyl-D-erythritol kinase n=1 Tax=Silvimonas amylolytica TaxID=449663 RepID=A0ABQ2PKA7_9NEIS|nr:4-(cytidine 5'-diphospho)-2-C-methyl-D-erythritol kinase [Silvimonas amylolytica]GGP25892.1 4-diphosphocytidyl-2-C-methyl-D-erythritol kinase [Silvimonas amylolytica]
MASVTHSDSGSSALDRFPATSEGWRSFPAPAKLNLFLHVIGRRADGYHLLQSVFQLVDLQDTIELRVRGDNQIEHYNPLPGVDPEDDLTVRAARLLQSHANITAGVDIRVTKRIPMGGGMGGGSSDAATVLLALNQLWGVNLSRQALMTLGLKLGADVPFFIFGRNAFVEGVGEIMTAHDTPETWFAVLHPQVHVSTPAIFKDERLTRDTPSITMRDLNVAATRNDLQPVALSQQPRIAESLKWLSQFGPARMTGSGSCVFTICASQSEADRVVSLVPEEMTGFVARSLQKHELSEFAEQ